MSGHDCLRKYLEASGKTRFDLAYALGVSPSTVHYWLKTSAPREAMRKKLQRATRGAVPAACWKAA